MTREPSLLLTLAERHPLRALHISAGRLLRVHDATEAFVAAYVPNPTTDEYTVLLNEAAPASNQRAALRAIVRHHTEAHAPSRVHVFRCTGPRGCEECAAASPRERDNDYHRRTMRRLNWG